MPYISSEAVKEKRNALKKAFPEYKISVTGRHHSSIYVSFLSGPIEMITNPFNGSRCESVNQFYIKEHYEGFPEVRDILLKTYEIVNKNNGEEVYDGDYGSVPNFYVNISVGDYERPYEVKK